MNRMLGLWYGDLYPESLKHCKKEKPLRYLRTDWN